MLRLLAMEEKSIKCIHGPWMATVHTGKPCRIVLIHRGGDAPPINLIGDSFEDLRQAMNAMVPVVAMVGLQDDSDIPF